MKIRTIITAAVLLLTTLMFAQPMLERKMPKDLNLTDAQQEQFEKINFDMQKKKIELTAKLATVKLEMNRFMNADQLDKAAIEKKMNEMAAQNIALRMNHLNAWSDKNKLLNADQQKIWRKMMKNHLRAMQSRSDDGMMPGKRKGQRMMQGHPGMDQDMGVEHPRMERRIEKEIIKE
jgi:Spy/CpxP family protein refolding chaperone